MAPPTINTNLNQKGCAIEYLPNIPINAFENQTLKNEKNENNYENYTENESLEKNLDLDFFMRKFSENLVFDAINIGSLFGMKIGPPDVSAGAAMISSLLNAGFTYVVSNGKLLALLPTARSVLTLKINSHEKKVPQQNENEKNEKKNEKKTKNNIKNNKKGNKSVETNLNKVILPSGLAKRLKDMPRIFRNKVDQTENEIKNEDKKKKIEILKVDKSIDLQVSDKDNSNNDNNDNNGINIDNKNHNIQNQINVKSTNTRKLSLRLNSDLNISLAKLRHHHGIHLYIYYILSMNAYFFIYVYMYTIYVFTHLYVFLCMFDYFIIFTFVIIL
jgi:hypothetical protein